MHEKDEQKTDNIKKNKNGKVKTKERMKKRKGHT